MAGAGRGREAGHQTCPVIPRRQWGGDSRGRSQCQGDLVVWHEGGRRKEGREGNHQAGIPWPQAGQCSLT